MCLNLDSLDGNFNVLFMVSVCCKGFVVKELVLYFGVFGFGIPLRKNIRN